MTTDQDDRTAWVRRRYSADVASYLLAGDGFRIEAARGQDGLGHAWSGIFAELVTAGFMRRSRTGRYWWLIGDSLADRLTIAILLESFGAYGITRQAFGMAAEAVLGTDAIAAYPDGSLLQREEN
jgi:hypothetical protein